MEEMYMANSRNEMNQTLLELLTSALVRPAMMPERVVLEHIMLIAILHANVGTEVGAFFIQSFTQYFKSKYDAYDLHSDDENKELENLSLIVSFIYHFKIVDACLIYDILKLLGESFKSKDIEIILTILRRHWFSFTEG
ncbi:Nucleolar MIF4G domain-containing protein 1 [Orchesella cincta]|uniref:Nucleolar MIF4G domain-containing protein 1 n=1 Tax=Orchesella cincta TaxID=48709 RepID=A0A1D2MSG9_ORCCI|nr:Nucleolar MIF4G domain-containing protein 1 [Orchesella cincta]